MACNNAKDKLKDVQNNQLKALKKVDHVSEDLLHSVQSQVRNPHIDSKISKYLTMGFGEFVCSFVYLLICLLSSVRMHCIEAPG